MYILSSNGLNTIIRNQELTVIVSRRPLKKGRFEYVLMSDMISVDSLLKDTISVDDINHLKRLISGFCPKREAYQYAYQFSDAPRELVEILEMLGILKEKPVVKDTVIAEYRLRDGYSIKLENDNCLFLREYENGAKIAETRVFSLREGLSTIRKTVDNIETLENVSFQIIKQA